MSLKVFVPCPRRAVPAGLFLFSLFFSLISWAQSNIDPCIYGFPPVSLSRDLAANESPHPLLPYQFRQWMRQHNWPFAYTSWQQSRQCQDGLMLQPACLSKSAPLPEQQVCGGAIDGYQFLVMHRYLLQSIKTVWPELASELSAWKKFPQPQDYPADLQSHVYPWPDAVMRAAKAVDTITKANAQQVRQRWPSEGEFGQWLQCGSNNGLAADALYPALLTNGIQAHQTHQTQPQLMDLYLFWQAHSWIDRAWEKYRRAIGKSPDEPQLQAALIQQCRVLNQWEKQQNAPKNKADKNTADKPLYLNGQLNPMHTGLARITGEVEDTKTTENGRTFLRVNPHLIGVNSIWISSAIPFDMRSINVGENYVFIGNVIGADKLDASGWREFIKSSALLAVVSIQSVK